MAKQKNNVIFGSFGQEDRQDEEEREEAGLELCHNTVNHRTIIRIHVSGSLQGPFTGSQMSFPSN